MKSSLTAAATGLALLGLAPVQAAAAPDELVIVEVTPLANDLAAHLQVGPDRIPPSVGLPSKLAAVVCERTLKQLRDSRGLGPNANCVAVGMSQGLIQAVRQEMRAR